MEISKSEKAALSRSEILDDPRKLRIMIQNARRQGSDIVEAAAFRRLCLIQPDANPGTVEHDVWQSIHALEELLREERGRMVRLSRTRQKIAKDGEAKTVSDLTLKPEPSQGFFDLLERGHPDLTFEAVALRHPNTFDQVVLDAACDRLVVAGVDPARVAPPISGV
ncbi:MAG: hypothetical protein ACXIVG_12610 [Pararhodobacter sp.]